MSLGRVQARGQVTVPRDIRDATGIVPGSDLLFIALGPGRFECRAMPERRSITDLARAFAQPGPAPDLDALREEMGDELAKRHLPQGMVS
jgi:bifunctional DNA-binding transcriptional regulator/antitoxin component of YhaV-PrlF toxin-antitoxin module